jgi:hypothetical protein
MKKLPKRPRTFGRTKAKPYPQKKQEPYSKGWTEREIQFFDELSPGFAEWYRRNFDEQGVLIGAKMQGPFGYRRTNYDIHNI